MQSKTLFESMSQGNFMQKLDEEVWTFLEELAENTMQWENSSEKPATAPTHKGGIHSIEQSIAAEAKMVVVMRRLEALEVKETPPQLEQVKQVSTPSCFNCQASNHLLEDCPHLPSHFANSIEQLNVVFQRQRNDPYGPTFNQGWKNHPNFSWAQGNYQGGPVPNQVSGSQFPRPNTGPYPNQNAFVNP